MRAYKTVTTKCSKTFYRVTGLLEGALYYFRVLPENIYGIGEGCETSDAVLVSDVPMVPQKLEVIDTTKSTVTLAWEKPLHDGGSRLTGYVIEASKAGTERWLKVVTLKPTVYEHTIISLNEVDANYVIISWEPPELDGGAALSGYVVEQRDAHRPGWLPVSESVTRTTFKFTRLVEGYRFRVLACNAGGPGEPAEVPGTVKITEMLGKTFQVLAHSNKPSQPGEIEITSIFKDSITLEWERPESDGGKEILGYWVEYRQSGESTWKKCNKERIKDRQFTVGGLLEATEYEFRVFAENQTGLSRPRRTAMAVKTKLTCKQKYIVTFAVILNYYYFFLIFFVAAGEAPAIKKEMQDVTTKLGEAAQLTCQIVGRPLPDIKWYRFGKELVQSRKYKMSSDGRNHTLTVMTDEQEDEGLYTCMATNDVGEIETSGKNSFPASHWQTGVQPSPGQQGPHHT
uniref:Titin n=1 Tax=Cyanoderma ruficeps TaxID=181631 RepID=A0A8C3R474_9PASS